MLTLLLNFYTDLQYSRTFATRNGFGPVPNPPVFNKNQNKNVTIYRELYHLLSTFTGAEEAAIRQISPLISIVRFPHGSLGSKGNTTCVWQQSKLNLILPNLPEECKFVIIRHKQKKRMVNPSWKVLSLRGEKYKEHWSYCLTLLMVYGKKPMISTL